MVHETIEATVADTISKYQKTWHPLLDHFLPPNFDNPLHLSWQYKGQRPLPPIEHVAASSWHFGTDLSVPLFQSHVGPAAEPDTAPLLSSSLFFTHSSFLLTFITHFSSSIADVWGYFPPPLQTREAPEDLLYSCLYATDAHVCCNVFPCL